MPRSGVPSKRKRGKHSNRSWFLSQRHRGRASIVRLCYATKRPVVISPSSLPRPFLSPFFHPGAEQVTEIRTCSQLTYAFGTFLLKSNFPLKIRVFPFHSQFPPSQAFDILLTWYMQHLSAPLLMSNSVAYESSKTFPSSPGFRWPATTPASSET